MDKVSPKREDKGLDNSFTLTLNSAHEIGDHDIADLHNSNTCLPKTKPKNKKSKGKSINPQQNIASVNGDLRAVRSSNLQQYE
jgi:hypothetical protein